MADTSLSLFSLGVQSSLLSNGYARDDATRIAQVYGVAYDYVDKTKTLYDLTVAGKTFRQASSLLVRAQQFNMGSEAIREGFKGVRAVSAAGVMSGFITAVDAAAKVAGVPLDECVIAVTKVSFDGVGIVGGSLSFETGGGAVLAYMSLLSFTQDGKDVIDSCLSR